MTTIAVVRGFLLRRGATAPVDDDDDDETASANATAPIPAIYKGLFDPDDEEGLFPVPAVPRNERTTTAATTTAPL